MSRWSSIALGVKNGAPVPHPLDGKGNPAYRARKGTLGTYQLASTYSRSGETRPSEELFDSRNVWRKDGVSSRLFPTWSSRALYEECGAGLYKALLRQYHLNRQLGHRDASEGPEDHWTDVQLYFIERTGREQMDYEALTGAFGSYSHYPMDPGYRDGDEVLLGILSLYHARIRECFKKKADPSPLSLDALEAEQGTPLVSAKDSGDFSHLAASLSSAIAQLKGMSEDGRKTLLELLTLDGTWPSRMKRLGNPEKKFQGLLRRWALLLETRILSDLLPRGGIGRSISGPASEKKQRRLILRRLAELILGNQEDSPSTKMEDPSPATKSGKMAEPAKRPVRSRTLRTIQKGDAP